jgi:hypothetical protein
MIILKTDGSKEHTTAFIEYNPKRYLVPTALQEFT